MFKKILVPLDASRLAEQSLPLAIHLAQKMKAEIILLSVAWKEEFTVFEPMGYGLYWPEDSKGSIQENLKSYLDQLLKKYAPSKVPLRSYLKQGDEAGMIVDTAVSEQVDLIIMSTHGRSGLSRWLLGSVTERVLRQAPCPILVLRDEALPKSILITLDGSTLAEMALDPGLALSLAIPAPVTLVRVEEKPKPAEKTGAPTANAYLRQIAARYPQHSLQIATPTGNPAEEILDQAAKLANSLIVICSHGRTGLARWVFGSVAEKVVRGTTGLVLVIWSPVHQLK